MRERIRDASVLRFTAARTASLAQPSKAPGRKHVPSDGLPRPLAHPSARLPRSLISLSGCSLSGQARQGPRQVPTCSSPSTQPPSRVMGEGGAAGTNSSELALSASAAHVSATYLPVYVASVASHGKGMVDVARKQQETGRMASRQVGAGGTSSHQQALRTPLLEGGRPRHGTQLAIGELPHQLPARPSSPVTRHFPPSAPTTPRLF